MSLPTVACFGQHANEKLIYLIEKTNNNAYCLISYDSTNQTMQPSVLLNISSNDGLSFQGLCTYADDSSSFYLDFKNDKLNTSQIYQLEANQSPKLKGTDVTFSKTNLFSIQYIRDANNQPQLAYVATQSTQQKIFGIVNILKPTLNYKNITELGTLAATNTPTSKNLYLIQNNSVEIYRLAEKQYNRATIYNGLFSTYHSSASGPIFVNSSMEYIPLYEPTTGTLKLLAHDTSLTAYSKLPLINDQISFSDQSIQTPSNTIIKNTSTTEAIPKMDATSRADPKKRRLYSKRSVTMTAEDKSMQATGYSLKTYTITNLNSGLSPDAVFLQSSTENTGSTNSIPYEFGTIVLDGNNTATISIQRESSSSSSPSPSVNSVIPETNTNHQSGLSAGAIAGIVLGSVAFLLLSAILLLCMKRRRSKKQRKLKTREMLKAYCGSKDFKGDTLLPSNLQQLHETVSKDSYSYSAAGIQDTKDILDDARPNIQPLCYTRDAIDYAELPEQELVQLEPDVKGPLYLFNGLYVSPESEQVNYVMDGYVTRTFRSEDGNKHTMHYFSTSHAHTFVHSVYAALRISLPGKETYTIKSERAIVLGSPTPHSNYQYIWISSPVMPDHSLHHLLFENNVWSFIDYHSSDYKIWSVYALLKSIESVHDQDFVHLAIEPKSFYFDHEMNATDWHLGNFSHTHALSRQQHPSLPIPTPYSAPELIENDKSFAFIEKSLDIWSLGCVIYTVATDGVVLFSSVEQVRELLKANIIDQHIEKAIQGTIENNAFAKILNMMLRANANERKMINEIVAYWHSVYNMEE
ncbi:hypothetical protein EDC96DRAFT_495341 [Choanephora cucurbitarum]|nr:hypothetical protein EDC96DRAFT_495341 [Choanephora cucurbitarum]